MNNSQKFSFKNATDKIDYTFMNDYMFRAVLQENERVLKELTCSLLHLNPDNVETVTILNPIELGEAYDDKAFVLDIKVLLNNAAIINLEMQVVKQDFWTNRSLSYLCSAFQNLKRGEDYSQVKPSCHVGILDFTPFPDYPEFYASNKMMNIKKHYIYNDNFTLNVLDLTQIHLATDEDKEYKIDYWAKLFKTKTWEDLKMLTQNNTVFEEASETLYKLNQDDKVRYLCEMREEGQRILQTYQSLIRQRDEKLAQKDTALAEKDAVIADKNAIIATKDAAIADKDATIAALQAQLAAFQK